MENVFVIAPYRLFLIKSKIMVIIIPKITKINKIFNSPVLKCVGIPAVSPCLNIKDALKLKMVNTTFTPETSESRAVGVKSLNLTNSNIKINLPSKTKNQNFTNSEQESKDIKILFKTSLKIFFKNKLLERRSANAINGFKNIIYFVL